MTNSKIKFVREYQPYLKYGINRTCYDAIYHSGRLCMYTEEDVPKTVQKFIENAGSKKKQYDPIFKYEEIIYE